MIDRYTVNDDSSDETRIAAFIHCCFGLDPDHLPEEEFWKLWGRVKFYLKIVHQVKFEE